MESVTPSGTPISRRKSGGRKAKPIERWWPVGKKEHQECVQCWKQHFKETGIEQLCHLQSIGQVKWRIRIDHCNENVLKLTVMMVAHICGYPKCLFRSSAYFLIRFFVFYCAVEFFIYFVINPWSDIWFAEISHLVGCIFILKMFLSICKSILVWSNLYFCIGFSWLLSLIHKIIAKIKGKLPMFSSRNFVVRYNIQVFNPFWVSFCVWYKVRV